VWITVRVLVGEVSGATTVGEWSSGGWGGVAGFGGGGAGVPIVGVGFDGVALSTHHSPIVVEYEVGGGVGWDVRGVWVVESEAVPSVELDVLKSLLC
jgi:hypothetical protein